MKTRIQLYKDVFGNGIEGYLDIEEQTFVPITFERSDILDLSKRRDTFSKTIKIIGNDQNNILLNNYFEVNILSGEFNINKIQKCNIIQNDAVLIPDLFFQLIGVDTKFDAGQNKQKTIYSCLVKNEVSDFFTKINGKDLTDINFSDFNHLLDSNYIINSWNNTDKFKYILPYFNGVQIKAKDCLLGIYAKEYLDRIVSNAGYSYEFPQLTDADIRFDKLILPWNGGSINLTDISEEYAVYLGQDKNSISFPTGQSTTTTTVFTDQLEITEELKDIHNSWNPTTFKYTAPYTAGIINYTFNLKYWLENTSILNQSSTQLTFSIQMLVYKNGVLNSQDSQTILTGAPSGLTINAGQSTVRFDGTKSIQLKNVQQGDEYEFFINVIQKQNSLSMFTTDVINYITLTNNTFKSTDEFNPPINVNNYIPKMKQSDFIKSICSIYYLIVDNTSNKLIFKTRDKYYDDGIIDDWNEIIDVDSYQIQFLTDLSNRRNILTYKQDKDPFNVNYLDTVKEVYGESQFTFDNEFIKGDKKIEITFSPTPVLSDLVENRYLPAIPIDFKSNFRILFDGGNFKSNQFTIVDYNTGSGTVGTSTSIYPMMTHFDNPLNPTFDINFDSCDYYYHSWNSLTKNNLFNLHYRRTFNQLNTGKMLTGYFLLNDIRIKNLKLNSKIYLFGKYWNINSIVDYNANSNNLTKVELISADELLKIPFRKRIIFRPTFNNISKPYTEVAKENDINSNNNFSQGNVTIIGKDNTISSNVTDTIVIGNEKIIDENGFYSDRVKVDELLNVSIASIEGLIVSDTRANIISLMNNELLNPGRTYHLSDKNIYLIATGKNELNIEGIRKFTVLSNIAYTISGINRGIWKSGMTINIGDIVVWGGRCWENLTGNTGTATNSIALDGTNWLLTDVYNIDKLFSIVYDLGNDWIVKQRDDRGNIIGVDYNNRYNVYNSLFNSFGIVNPIDVTDWGNISISNNQCSGILNNRFRYIVNNIGTNLIINNYTSLVNGDIKLNKFSDSIFGNDIAGSIDNNTLVSIGGNTLTTKITENNISGSINGNNVVGEISFNKNIGNISSNVLLDSIISNSNVGNINGNTNDGDIINNANNGEITNNANNGDIESNTNDGYIKDNTNSGKIYFNTNGGYIKDNSCSEIFNNKNIGNIYDNSNVGNILNNINGGDIRENTNNGDIRFNGNGGGIFENTQTGTAGIFSIENNNNNGNINNNTYHTSKSAGNFTIELNYNTGAIYSNITNQNTGAYTISLNRNNGAIFSNIQGTGTAIAITTNINNGNIASTTRITNVTDTVADK